MISKKRSTYIPPPILLSSSLILGLSLSSWFQLTPFIAVILIGIACSIPVFILSSRVQNQIASSHVLLAMTAAALIGLSLGSLQMQSAGDIVIPEGDLARGVTVVCDAQLIDDPVIRERNARVDVSLRACRLPHMSAFQLARGRVRLYVYGGGVKAHAGDVIRFQGRIRLPRDFRNPGSFSWKRFLMSRGIGAVGTVSHSSWTIRLPAVRSNGFVGILSRIRQRLDATITRETDESASGVLRALVAGNRQAVNDDVRTDFQRAGIAHLLAISGLHVGYIALFLYLVMWVVVGRWTRLIVRIPLQKIAAAITLPLVWCFIMLVGAPVSAVRAGIMISVYLVGLVMGWRQDLLTTLAVAALIVVALEPLAILDISFQLSFVSVFAILLIVPRLLQPVQGWFADRHQWRWRMVHRMLQLVAVTIAAAIGSMPLVAYHFHMVTGAGFIANLFAVPWTGLVIVPLSALASVVNAAWSLAGWSVDVLIAVARIVAGVSEPVIFSVAPSMLTVVVIYMFIAILVFWPQLSYRRWLLGLIAAGFIFNTGWVYMKPLMTDELEVTFLDVGQGDSALIRFPGGKTMLIDGGGLPSGEFDIGRHVVVPTILAKGIHALDIMVLSHPHHDHYRGLGAVAEQFHPDELWLSYAAPPEEEQELWDDFLSRVEKAGVRMRRVDGNAEPMAIDGVVVEIIHPRGVLRHDIDPNDASLVIRFSYGEVSFLFTGDLMEYGEQSLIAHDDDLRSTILKVAHHGSETSSMFAFLERVKPRIAIMSVGQYNRYDMPDDIVLERLEAIDAAVYRTDHDGAITVRTDGKHLSIARFPKR